MLKVTQLGYGVGIRIQTILLQFRNKIGKFSAFMDNKQTHKYINTGCMGARTSSRQRSKKNYAEEIMMNQ